MSVKIMGLVWDLSNEEIEREEKYILLAYADHADHKGYNIFPAIATIAEKTGYKERAVQTITRSLNAKGYLISDGKGPRGTNKWRVPLSERGAEIAPVKNAGMQNEKKGGAKSTGKGVHPNAPEPSEPSFLEPSIKTARPQKEPIPPEILVYREVTHLYPPKPNWKSVVKIVQSISARLCRDATAADLLPFFQEWTFRGNRPTNINWTSWAVAGRIPPQGPQIKQNYNNNAAILQAFAAKGE